MINNKDSFSFNVHDTLTLTEKEWSQDVNKHMSMYNQLKDTEVMGTEIIDNLINNDYDFWIVVRNNDPYFHNDCYLVSLYLRYINKPIVIYLNKAYLNMITGNKAVEKTTEEAPAIESVTYGIIAYDRPLTDSELFDYDLIPYEPLKKAV